MTDIAERVEQLRLRIKRKRDEVESYLDGQYYMRCRDILRRAELLDDRHMFASDPSRLPEYHSSVNKPMYWALIGRNLASYKYASEKEFIADMRLVSDNCYAYNGEAAPVSETARQIEVLCEDAFVKELGEEPPSMSEIQALAKRLTQRDTAKVAKLYNLYENAGVQSTAGKVSLRLSACRCATKRRMLKLMRHAVSAPANRAPQRGQQSARPGPSGPTPVKQPHRPPTAAPKAPPPGHPALHQAPDELKFHQETRAPTALERVPQNERISNFGLQDIGSVPMDEDSLSYLGSEGSSDFDPLSSDFALVGEADAASEPPPAPTAHLEPPSEQTAPAPTAEEPGDELVFHEAA